MAGVPADESACAWDSKTRYAVPFRCPGPCRCTNQVLDEPWSEAGRVQVVSPKKPRSNVNLIVSFCLLLRLEVFLAVSREAQCSSSGIEVCLHYRNRWKHILSIPGASLHPPGSL